VAWLGILQHLEKACVTQPNLECLATGNDKERSRLNRHAEAPCHDRRPGTCRPSCMTQNLSRGVPLQEYLKLPHLRAGSSELIETGPEGGYKLSQATPCECTCDSVHILCSLASATTCVCFRRTPGMPSILRHCTMPTADVGIGLPHDTETFGIAEPHT
jgi:hypothetical protein